MTDELKPCPFCGGTNLKLYGESAPEWWVSCHSCFASSRTQANKANAISAWNTRAALQEQDREDDPLQPAADWLLRALPDIFPNATVLQAHLMIGYNRAKWLFDHARRVEGEGE